MKRTIKIPSVVVASGNSTRNGNGQIPGTNWRQGTAPMTRPIPTRKWIPNWHSLAPGNQISSK